MIPSEPDDLLALGARGVREREARQALQEYVRRHKRAGWERSTRCGGRLARLFLHPRAGLRPGLRPAPHRVGPPIQRRAAMSAGLTSSDSMFSVRVTPWHGLGAVLDRPPATVAEAIEAAGLGWGVVKKALATDLGSDLPDVLRYKRFPGYYATVRQDTGEELGVVGERRTAPSPNRLIWRSVCQPSGSSVDVGLVAGGALSGRHGRKVQCGRLRGQTDIRGLVTSRPVFVAARCLRAGAARREPAAHSVLASLARR